MVTVRCTVCSAKSARHSKRLATPTVHTASIAISLLVYIFALKNKKTTHLDTEQGHAWVGSDLERALQAKHGLSVVEFTVLDALGRQDGWHMRMAQLARAAALSSSATTRLVTRLEDRALLTRILCADDRRGIYTELTAAGEKLLNEAHPTHDAVLQEALENAAKVPEFKDLVTALAPANV